jgi:hypothetical protein
MNRTKSFMYNSVSTAIMQIITMIVGLITPRIMLQFYGSEINGLVSSISQFIGYFSLVEAGLSGAAIYALYKPLADNDHKAINGVVSAARKFYIQSGYIFSSLILGMAILYPMLVKTDALTPINVGLLVMVIGVSGALEFFTLAKYRVLLSADQRIYVISLASTLSIIFNAIIIVVLARFRVNIVVLKTVGLTSIFARSFILYIYVKNRYKYINYAETPNHEALNKRWSAFYLQILSTIHVGTPVVLATIFTSLKMVSVYSIFNMVIGAINGILSVFTSGLAASFGNLIVSKEQNILQQAYKEFEFAYYSLIAVVYSITMVTIMPFIRIYTKGVIDINYDIPLLGFFFVLNGLLYNLKTPQGMLVVSAGLYKETRLQTTIQGGIAVVGGIVFAPFWGLYGILVGSILSNLYRDIDLLFFIPHNVTKLRVRYTFYRQCRIIVSAAIIWLPFYFINPQIANVGEWFLFAIIVGIYSVAVLVIMGFLFDRNEMKNIFKRVLPMIGGNK